MYLKSLTLKGFKSFADRTQLEFDPGLTVVVGPNGSGKSNVSDAILWVLGEQSAKMLRGQAMEDVIFSGSSARQPVGVAEVTLILDNTDHTLPVDFSEVGITRRMYRSGESEYLINGSPARLMDIQDILHDSGLGKDTHSIISQGKLDSVLSSKPEQRRQLIEEAAGISKHRRRKERSARKMRSMEENLVRAKDISRVINRQLKPLERQVSKAQRAGVIETKLAEGTTVLAVDDLRQLKMQWSRLSEQQKEAEAELELNQYRLGEKKRDLEKLQVMLEQKGLFVGDLGEQRRRMQDMLGRMDSDMRLLEEKGKNMVDKLSEMRRSLSTIENQRQDAQSELERTEADVVEATKAEEVLSAQVEELGPKASLAREKRTQLDNKFSEISGAIRSEQRICDQETLAFARLSETISNAEVEDGMYKSRLASIEETINICQDALTKHLKAKEELTSKVSELSGLVEETRTHLNDIRSSQKEASKAEDEARKELSQAEASLRALESVEESLKDINPLTTAITKDSRSKGLISCRLGDLFEAPSDLEPLIERLLGEDLQALVVDDANAVVSMQQVAANLKKGGSTTVVAKSGLAKTTSLGTTSAKRLSDVLTIQDSAKELIESLLGDICLVDTFEDAIREHSNNSAYTYVTHDGSMVLPDGRSIFGEASTSQKGALERKRRIRSLNKAMPDLHEALNACVVKTKELSDEYASTQQKLSGYQGDLARVKGELNSVLGDEGRLSSQLTRATREKSEVEEQRQAVAKKAAEAKSELDGHKAKAAEAEAKVKDLNSELVDLEDARQIASRDEKDLTGQLSDARLELAKVSERKRHQQNRQQDLTVRVSNLDKRRSAIEAQSCALEVLRLRVDPLHETCSSIQEVAWMWASRLRDRASLAEADSDSLKKTISDARREVGKAHGAVDSANAKAANIKVDVGKLEVQVENSIQAIIEIGAYTLEEALALPAPEDADALKAEVSKLKRQLEDIGPVNQVAMDEYTKLKEKADYINAQVDDLEAARKSLIRITSAIDRKMRKQFLVTFDEVNENFKQIFAMLFPGGTAYIEMLDPDHPSETGIEIFAQPRGKRFTKISLLSGGERSLTALALLFAVYKTRTVPFYVFDEVEAALDASNLSKLLDAIEMLKETTQLIVISHQRRTMEQADVLYGVSMQADGVSHVVSQRLDATGKVVDA